MMGKGVFAILMIGLYVASAAPPENVFIEAPSVSLESCGTEGRCFETLDVTKREGSQLILTCTMGVIEIQRAIFGNREQRCTANIRNALSVANGKTVEVQLVRAQQFGVDPGCPAGTPLEALVRYTCICEGTNNVSPDGFYVLPTLRSGRTAPPNIQFSSFACENQELRLSCDQGAFLSIDAANYGRTISDSEQCPRILDHANVVNCLSNGQPSGLEIVRNLCQGQRRCGVSATNTVFGDPCPGTFKYLEVSFSCVNEEDLPVTTFGEQIESLRGLDELRVTP